MGRLWCIWLTLTITAAAFVLAAMFHGGSVRGFLLTGQTTNGHHQIEAACDACHAKPFGGAAALQKTCLTCHGEALKLANDSHAAKKFVDPRNADRLAKLNARLCVSCHREHSPSITRTGGVSLPKDYCVWCHKDIARERPSHQGVAFSDCARSGCHNVHDNRGLYEDFLLKHLNEPAIRLNPVVALKVAPPPAWDDRAGALAAPIPRAAADAPPEKLALEAVLGDGLEVAHARAGVNCSGCHAPKDASGSRAAWSDRPGLKICANCHALQASAFVEGKHGMRLRDGLFESRSGLSGLFSETLLTPMRPDLARALMREDAHIRNDASGRELRCATCHEAHRFDTVKAQVERCLSCHADRHSLAYLGSSHYRLWKAEAAGALPKGRGVSCATCHMPREEHRDGYGHVTRFVNHNQNANLRPNAKMVRSACLDCHGLAFALDALADRELIANNFNGSPKVHVESLDWAARRKKEKEHDR